MKLVCITKPVPDGVSSDQEPQVPIRDTPAARLHPDDASAIGFALEIKRHRPETQVDVLILTEKPATALAEDIARVGANRVILIKNTLYQGSDSLTEARIIARALEARAYDCILAGSQTVEGGAACLPPQLAELLEINHLPFIRSVEEAAFSATGAVVETEDGAFVRRYAVDFPAILGLSERSGYRLPYPRLKEQRRDVSERIVALDNRDLKFAPEEVGAAAASSRTVTLHAANRQDRAPEIVDADAMGVERVHGFLKQRGIL
ncbi:hypothetical protein R3X27_07600 [Tropicimonas sp. TH_r6]|uniref:electron transfer flavoprotein subunit beta/FixA family protein n=1 Tax=Tropicimonas sp. TH_r6 TaxID=3082085 RepID=UPI0029535417|nr:hypothetical protein [Tropicimonas sp. TH_r6]MDV7142546.1 hypothetical protein [Tropicimonas sp. TH_r6]